MDVGGVLIAGGAALLFLVVVVGTVGVVFHRGRGAGDSSIRTQATSVHADVVPPVPLAHPMPEPERMPEPEPMPEPERAPRSESLARSADDAPQSPPPPIECEAGPLVPIAHASPKTPAPPSPTHEVAVACAEQVAVEPEPAERDVPEVTYTPVSSVELVFAGDRRRVGVAEASETHAAFMRAGEGLLAELRRAQGDE